MAVNLEHGGTPAAHHDLGSLSGVAELLLSARRANLHPSELVIKSARISRPTAGMARLGRLTVPG